MVASEDERNVCLVKGIKRNRALRHIRVRPVVKRYFFIAPADILLSNDFFVIYPQHCVDDFGVTAQKFLNYGKSGYFNVYINGVMQGSSVYQVNSLRLKLAPTGQTIYKGTSIIIESIGFYLALQK